MTNNILQYGVKPHFNTIGKKNLGGSPVISVSLCKPLISQRMLARVGAQLLAIRAPCRSVRCSRLAKPSIYYRDVSRDILFFLRKPPDNTPDRPTLLEIFRFLSVSRRSGNDVFLSDFCFCVPTIGKRRLAHVYQNPHYINYSPPREEANKTHHSWLSHLWRVCRPYFTVSYLVNLESVYPPENSE